MSNKSPLSILHSARIFARPVRNGKARAVSANDCDFLQLCFDGLGNAPQKWTVIIKTACDYADDYHPVPLDSGLWWFRAFRYSVSEQVAGENLGFWGLSYPQEEGALVRGYYGSGTVDLAECLGAA